MRTAAGGGADPARLLPKSMRKQMQESAAAAAAEKQLQEEVAVSGGCLVWGRRGGRSSAPCPPQQLWIAHGSVQGEGEGICCNRPGCRALDQLPGSRFLTIFCAQRWIYWSDDLSANHLSISSSEVHGAWSDFILTGNGVWRCSRVGWVCCNHCLGCRTLPSAAKQRGFMTIRCAQRWIW